MRTTDKTIVVPGQAKAALRVLRQSFSHGLAAVYLHGSAVSGGLRPNSDVDLLVVVDQAMAHTDRARLLGQLMAMSAPPGASATLRPLELMVFLRADLAAAAYPARSEFVYGEWLREAFDAGDIPQPVSDPELTLVLAQAGHEAIALFGPHPAELLPAIPWADVRRAIGDGLPALLDGLDGDERNVLLTLARMWRTLATEAFVPKDVAADWAMPRLTAESAALLDCARRAYLGETAVDWRARRREVLRTADELRDRVMETL